MNFSWPYVIPLFYLVVLVVIGVWVSKRQETRSDFYVASNKMNSGVLFTTIFSTVVGANTYMGFSGMVYNDGFSMTWLLVAAGSAYFVLFFISGKLRRIASVHEVFTLPDMMELRYSRPVALVTTLFSLVALIGGAGGSILGVGVILNSILGIDTTVAILITSVVTILYTAFGGLMGVALTDWVQSMIMIAGLVLVILFGFQAMSADANIFNATLNGADLLSRTLGGEVLSFTEGMTFIMVIAWAFTFMPLNTISQTQMQRVYAAKSEKVIQRISLLMVLFVALFMAFGLALVGVIGQAITPALDNPETVFPMLAMEVINPWVGMVIVTGILGACMSTVDSNLLSAGIHVSRDIYERGKKGTGQPIQEKQSITITRITLVVIGALSTVAAIFTPSIMELLLVTMHIFAGATFAPIIIGIYWKRANAGGAMLGLLLGGVATIVAEVTHPPLDPVIIGILFSIAGVVIGSLLTRENVEKGNLFAFKAVEGKDYTFLLVVAGIYVLFLLGLTSLSLWTPLIVLTILALIFSLVMLTIYILPNKRRGMYEEKSSDIKSEQ
ncbi:sodium:solute symporter family protein [Pseudalkalibacillus caeni]|uniref:Sodium:solute symporter family protein n=1 Tax=Exobacillus caeni TaxID=2574798 RepID=A0A5R9EYT1_9BACL|nr:sodium:solute symporter family protein [Pseudalkalibacillus caeni]TLS35599.1 sodium:solute symporter family protein [Pseudalkalibacillus caeni]